MINSMIELEYELDGDIDDLLYSPIEFIVIPYIGMKILLTGLNLTIQEYYIDFDYSSEILCVCCKRINIDEKEFDRLKREGWN